MMLTADEALAQLREGNGRFVNDGRVVNDLTSRERRSAVSGGQEPFAIVLGCADARVPAEIIFDQRAG
jgi:carbonic anhydrase